MSSLRQGDGLTSGFRGLIFAKGTPVLGVTECSRFLTFLNCPEVRLIGGLSVNSNGGIEKSGFMCSVERKMNSRIKSGRKE